MKLITLEQAASILKELPNFAPKVVRQEGEIVGWDFPCDDGTVLRAPPLAVPWLPHQRNTWPFRYMTSIVPIDLFKLNGRHTATVSLPVGTRFKIVMASRFEDVGITDDLNAEYGYHQRVKLADLDKMFKDFSNNA